MSEFTPNHYPSRVSHERYKLRERVLNELAHHPVPLASALQIADWVLESFVPRPCWVHQARGQDMHKCRLQKWHEGPCDFSGAPVGKADELIPAPVGPEGLSYGR